MGIPGGKDHLGRGGIGFDVPFRVRLRAGLVAARDRAPHQRDALDLFRRQRVSFDHGRHVGEFADGDQGDLPGIAVELAAQKIDGAFLQDLRAYEAIRPARLLDVLRRSGHTGDHRHLPPFPARFPQELGRQARPRRGIAGDGGHAEQFKFGAVDDQRQGKGIVNIGADVGVEDHGNLPRRVCRCEGNSSNYKTK